MKRIVYLLMALLFAAGCSKYDYQLSDPGLTVKESLLDFTAKGGEGYIVVESNTPIEAKSNSDWCQVKVDGKRINVTVPAYYGIEYRTAVVAITTANGYPVNVPVTQMASQFIIGNLTYDVEFLGAALKTNVVSDKEVTVATTYGWIETRYERDSVFITVSRNDNLQGRMGTVEVTSNNITQSITIRQGGRTLAFEDVLGDWEMGYQTSPTSAVVRRTVRFVKSATDGYYDITGLQYGVLKAKFNNSNKTLEIYAGQNMGVFNLSPYQGWTIVPLTLSTDNYISWSTDFYYKGVWNNMFGADMRFTFVDSGSWPEKTITGLYIVVSSTYPVQSGSYVAIIIYYNITLKKL